MHTETVQTYSGKQAPKIYDAECENFWGKFPRRIIENFAQFVGHNQLVIDAGSGTGRGSLQLKINGLQPICLDASPSMVDYTHDTLDIPSIQGDFSKLPFASSSIRGIWASRSLINIPQEELFSTLFEMRRVLGRDGILGIVMLEPRRKETGGNSITQFDGGSRMVARYTPTELEKILTNCRFDVVDFERFKSSAKTWNLAFLAKKNQ